MLYKVITVVLILSVFGVPAALAQPTACSVAYGDGDSPERFSTTFANDTGIDLMIHWVDRTVWKRKVRHCLLERTTSSQPSMVMCSFSVMTMGIFG